MRERVGERRDVADAAGRGNLYVVGCERRADVKRGGDAKSCLAEFCHSFSFHIVDPVLLLQVRALYTIGHQIRKLNMGHFLTTKMSRFWYNIRHEENQQNLFCP